MNKAIHDMIEKAMATLTEAEKKEKKLADVYKGYLSSLGASMRMSGLIPTMAFFSSKENSAKGDRWKVLDWIASVLKESKQGYADLSSGRSLFERSLKANEHASTLEKDILDASVALKLSIRTFDLAKK
ncbi:MAG: type III-B CRISPR module-associated protein Cmr5 [Chitinophagaceae bacterium]|nr:type III-B CRISPR module-associated protein Cmr5 [Chitinophagaceae bacterium]